MTHEHIIDIAAAKRSAETAEIMRRYNDVSSATTLRH